MIQDIYAIYLREMIRIKRSRVRLVTTMVMPLLWLGIIGNAFNSAFKIVMPVDFISFLTPGIMVMTMVFTGTISGITTVFDREFGFLKEMLVAPVRRESVLIGKMLGGVTQSIFQGIIILILGFIMGMKLVSSSPVMAVAGMLLTMLLVSMAFVSFGLAVASKMSSMEGFQMVMNFMIQPMVFLSGAFYPVSSLPGWLQWGVKVNPLTYGVDAMRYFSINLHEFPIWLDFSVLAVFSAALITLGGWAFRKS